MNGEAAPSSPEIPRLAEHLFRQEAGKMISALTGIFGIHRLQLAEDVVQESLIRALQTWPYYGVPANPAAWLMQTAKNRALDLLRREKSFHEKQDEIAATLERMPEDGPQFDDEIRDHRLRLIFTCCHPQIPHDDRTLLALKTLCGFGIPEIASAFLASEAAVAKRLTRAKQKIQDQQIPYEIPAGNELAERMDAVLQVIYLLFNEGYKASSGDALVRADLCEEAIRLAGHLAEHPRTDAPRVHALAALMLFNASRLPARESPEGELLTLERQDRTRWDRQKIARGMLHLAHATRGDSLSEYHLQAGIAACHATAPDDASTDWPRILAHYDHWVAQSRSPLVALNRAVALAKVQGPEAALEAIAAIPDRRLLESYHLYHAVLGDLALRLGREHEAADHFRQAIRQTPVETERAFLTEKLNGCVGAGESVTR
ncbi:sigma-70 family RNA polymerase sigma factor [Luteolibacter flavescens]|uniref:Sigma-70 family RNA polymerase sigma factor n=1 Tax=Luteolibacter flavescens TaxID=1859460 RepID=A0ABT3FS74_9BACT|nr:sigma-70 family RNA polymerase sigma factor [Luteolibacter flavescens]MCW1886433.1 sigma-70 family RNA polymerase sigma factor [Luteolibacter flavescens]